jgi:hypothetical protein
MKMKKLMGIYSPSSITSSPKLYSYLPTFHLPTHPSCYWSTKSCGSLIGKPDSSQFTPRSVLLLVLPKHGRNLEMNIPPAPLVDSGVGKRMAPGIAFPSLEKKNMSNKGFW